MAFYKKISYIFIILISCSALYSQVKQEPKERNVPIEEPVIFKDSLPKISLPDFVITGKEKIDITNRNKIELIESRVYTLPGNLNNNFESKDISGLVAAPQKRNIASDKLNIFSGFVKGEYGNFNSPAISAGAAYRYDIYQASFTGSYISRDENVSNSDYSMGNAGLSLGADIPETDNIFSSAKTGLNLSYKTKNYNYYGLIEDPYILYGWPAFPDRLDKENNSFAADAFIKSEEEKYFKYDAEIIFNRFKDENGYSYLMPFYTENRFQFNISGQYEYRKFIFSGKALINNNNVKRISNPYNVSNNSLLFGIFLNAQNEVLPSIYAQAGIKYYSYEDLFSYRETIDPKENIVLPQFSVRYENNKNLSLSFCYAPDLEIMSLEKLYSLNPYIYPVKSGHLINTVNLFVLLDYSYSSNLRVKAALGYLEQKNTINYREAGGVPFVFWLADVMDEKAKGIYSNLNINYLIDNVNSFSFKLNYQNKRVESIKIPYTPDISCSLDYFCLLNIGLTLNPSIDIIGERRSNGFYEYLSGGKRIYPGEIKTMKSIFLLNLSAEYPILKYLIASIDLNNILNTRYSYYRGFEEYPFSIFAGIKFKW